MLRFILLFALIILYQITPAFALNEQAENPPPLDWQFTHDSDGWYGFQGGLKNQASYLSKSDLRIEMDLEKLMRLKNYSALLEIQNINGMRPNLYVDSLQGFDSIEYDRVSTMTYLYQLWLQRQIGEHWSILGGFYDLNSEFYLTDSSTLLVLPAFGIGTDLGETGPNGPSIFPVIGTGLRLKFAPTEKIYFQGVILDAAAANPLNRAYPYPPFSSGDGILGVYEMGYLFLGKDGSS